MNQCKECQQQTTNPKFCSLSCSVKSQMRNRPKKVYASRLCKQCSEPFVNRDSRALFCGRSCSATFNNLMKGRAYDCLNCHSGLGRTQKKYCSRSCAGEYRKTQKIERWLSGEDVYTATPNTPSFIRNYLLDEAGYRCTSPSCCVPGGWAGFNLKSGKTCLTVDHIDGDATNNVRSNLRILCPNCHSLTETYGALNVGNGTRQYRRDAYSARHISPS